MSTDTPNHDRPHPEDDHADQPTGRIPDEDAATPQATNPQATTPQATTPQPTPVAPVAPAQPPHAAQSQPAHTGAAFAHAQQHPDSAPYAQNTHAQNTHAQGTHAQGTHAPGTYAQGTHAGTTQPQGKQKQARRGGIGVGVVAAVAVAAVLGGGIGAGATLLVAESTTAAGTPVQQSTSGGQNITISDSADVDLVTGIAAKATPSVVTISASSTSASGTGSGVVLTEDGYVVTNNHVVTLDGASDDATISVTMSDGTIYPAEVVGTDPTLDLAVIKLQDASGLTPIEFADESSVEVGDTTVVIGAPLGLASSVTTGVVSALNRSITVASSEVPEGDSGDESEDGNGRAPYNFWQYGEQDQTQATTTISLPVIQTDASINPGNSGGALLNAQGELIGVNVAIASAGGSSGASGSIGIGFAIPADVVTRVTDEIIESGTASHGLLGASVSDAASHQDATVAGAYIESVVDGGGAAEAGLEAGDVVTSFAGHPVSDATDLTAQVRGQAAGASVDLEYVRDGQTYSLQVTLGNADQ